jgi:hypothetical protein
MPRGGQVEALIRAGDSIVTAGPVDRSKRGESKGFIKVFSADKGEKTSEIELPVPPVYDGIAAAYGRLYVTLANGDLVCLSP